VCLVPADPDLDVNKEAMVPCTNSDCPYEWVHVECIKSAVAPLASDLAAIAVDDAWLCLSCARGALDGVGVAESGFAAEPAEPAAAAGGAAAPGMGAGAGAGAGAPGAPGAPGAGAGVADGSPGAARCVLATGLSADAHLAAAKFDLHAAGAELTALGLPTRVSAASPMITTAQLHALRAAAAHAARSGAQRRDRRRGRAQGPHGARGGGHGRRAECTQ